MLMSTFGRLLEKVLEEDTVLGAQNRHIPQRPVQPASSSPEYHTLTPVTAMRRADPANTMRSGTDPGGGKTESW